MHYILYPKPGRLLRLRRKDVLVLAAEYPDLEAQLKNTEAMRSEKNTRSESV